VEDYHQAILPTGSLDAYYLDAAQEVLYIDGTTFEPELDLLAPFVRAYEESATYFTAPTPVLDAVRALQAHVLSRAVLDPDGGPFTDINDWLEYNKATISVAYMQTYYGFAYLSGLAGYPIYRNSGATAFVPEGTPGRVQIGGSWPTS
jgi:hypothetical protein